MCDDLWCVRVCDSQSPPKKASAFRLSLGRVECIRPMLLDVAVRFGLAHLDISLFPFSVHEGSKSWKNWRDTQLGRLRMVQFEYPKLSYLWRFSTFGYLPFPIFSS